jgi:hypothetical protein
LLAFSILTHSAILWFYTKPRVSTTGRARSNEQAGAGLTAAESSGRTSSTTRNGSSPPPPFVLASVSGHRKDQQAPLSPKPVIHGAGPPQGAAADPAPRRGGRREGWVRLLQRRASNGAGLRDLQSVPPIPSPTTPHPHHTHAHPRPQPRSPSWRGRAPGATPRAGGDSSCSGPS